MDMGLMKDCLVTKIANQAAAGTTTITSSVLDMSGYDGVLFIVATGDATSGTVLTLQAVENTANSTSGGTNVTGGSCTYTSLSATDADNKLLMVDVVRPSMRYAFCTLARATQNCVLDSIIAIQYKTHNKPVTQWSGTIASATSTPEV